MGILSHLRIRFHNLFFRRILYGVVAALAVFITKWDRMDRVQDRFKAAYFDRETSFDFIVVGGGTAGSVIANRLSEKYSVLLLEAGGEPHPFQTIPNFAFAMLNYPELDWMHKTAPQKHACFSLPNQQSGWSSGRNLGGSSNLNFLTYLRGHPRDYDNWATITGDLAWSYEQVLPYFKRMEDFNGPAGTDKSVHGYGGPLSIQIPHYTGMAKEWIYAGKELGFDHVDLNGRFTEGFDAIYNPIRRGRRDAVFRAYIRSIRRRPNLTIHKFSHVTKILIKLKTKEAYGVEYDRHGIRRKAFAKKEVVLSAGTVNSPKLLMLSGIGPEYHLKSHGIHPIQSLPVGQNLQDHMSTFIGPFFVKEGRSFLLDRDVTASSFAQFAFGRGVLTSSGSQATALVSSTVAKAYGEGDWADTQLILNGYSTHMSFPEDFSHAFGVNLNIGKKFYSHARGNDTFMIIVSAGRPKARGEILLKDNNPYSPIHIDPNYLNNDHDLKVMIEGVRLAFKIVEETKSFQELKAEYTRLLFPGCESHLFKSDEYWECHIRHLSLSLQNHVGSCSMGHPDSPHAVVDPELKVIGIKHLRVVDASIMPALPVANTMAPVIMIAEKAADIIKSFWQNKEIQENHSPEDIQIHAVNSFELDINGYGNYGEESKTNVRKAKNDDFSDNLISLKLNATKSEVESRRFSELIKAAWPFSKEVREELDQKTLPKSYLNEGPLDFHEGLSGPPSELSSKVLISVPFNHPSHHRYHQSRIERMEPLSNSLQKPDYLLPWGNMNPMNFQNLDNQFPQHAF